MPLTAQEVRKFADLARLRFSSEEEKSFVEQLSKIVDYFDQLGEFEASEGTVSSRLEALEREDRAGESIPQDRLLANAPEGWEGFLVVPKVKGDA
jgi:aspartyl-tRNA(Asn)/glutamyl-tRNA(Gln) amidotransferase subunit C